MVRFGLQQSENGAGAELAPFERPAQCFNGRIQDVRTVSRELDQAGISSLSSERVGGDLADDVVSDWDFGTGIGTDVATDVSGSGHDGVVVNIPSSARAVCTTCTLMGGLDQFDPRRQLRQRRCPNHRKRDPTILGPRTLRTRRQRRRPECPDRPPTTRQSRRCSSTRTGDVSHPHRKRTVTGVAVNRNRQPRAGDPSRSAAPRGHRRPGPLRRLVPPLATFEVGGATLAHRAGAFGEVGRGAQARLLRHLVVGRRHDLVGKTGAQR
jgi:hypothetical protein